MPVVSNAVGSRLQLKFNVGNDENGRPIIKTKTLSNVKSDALDQDIMDISQAMAALQTNILSAVVRLDEKELVNE